jgi:hypothetical protein
MGTNIAPLMRREPAGGAECGKLKFMESRISDADSGRWLSDPIDPPHCTLAQLSEILPTIPKPDPEFWDEVEERAKNQSNLPETSW